MHPPQALPVCYKGISGKKKIPQIHEHDLLDFVPSPKNHNDHDTSTRNKRTKHFERFSIEGTELSNLNLSRYLFAVAVLILCLLILLWSRLHLSKTRMKLGEAQKSYEIALKENQRLELEINYILSPTSIDQQIKQNHLDPMFPSSTSIRQQSSKRTLHASIQEKPKSFVQSPKSPFPLIRTGQRSSKSSCAFQMKKIALRKSITSTYCETHQWYWDLGWDLLFLLTTRAGFLMLIPDDRLEDQTKSNWSSTRRSKDVAETSWIGIMKSWQQV